MIKSQSISSDRKSNKGLPYSVCSYLFLGVFLFGTRYATPVQAQAEKIQLEVVPSEVAVIPDRMVEIQVTIRNLSNSKIQNVQLSAFTDINVKIEIEAPKNSSLEPQSILTWTFRIMQVGNDRVDGVVHARADYTWKPEDSENLIPGVSYATLAVKTYLPSALHVLPEIQVKTVLTNLIEGQSGIVYVVIKNGSELPIRIKTIEPDGPDFIRFSQTTPKEDSNTELIQSNESRVFRYTVETDKFVTPGKYLLFFKVDFSWKYLDYEWPGTAIATHEVDVSVFGESGIMSVLGLAAAGIPIFIILPGILMIGSFGVLWSWFRPKAGEFIFKSLAESLKKLDFWVLAITLSLLMIPLYQKGSAYLDLPRDLLKGYGFEDVVMVWFASILLATIGFFFYAILITLGSRLQANISRSYRTWKRHLLIPTEQDTPLTILKKLSRQRLGFGREKAGVTIQGQKLNNQVYLLETYAAEKAEYWVAPRIQVKWQSNLTPIANIIFKAAQRLLNRKSQNVYALVIVLYTADRMKIAHLTWEITEPRNLRGPILVKIADLQLPLLSPSSIVTMDQSVD